MNGCATTSVQIVKIDSFCTGKYERTILLEKDFRILDKIRNQEKIRETLNKILNPLTLNEKEFKKCRNLANHQPQN